MNTQLTRQHMTKQYIGGLACTRVFAWSIDSNIEPLRRASLEREIMN